MSKIKDYFKGIKTEFKHINWPTRKQAFSSTMLVVGISIFVALLLGLFDFLFSTGLTKLLEN